MASGDSEIQDVTSNSGDKQQECEKAESPKPGCSKYDDTPVETPEVTARPESPEPNCSICLCAMTNKSFTDTCFHTFCFICLLEWSKVNPVCPLCKKKFDSIIHTVKSIDQYEQYYIPPRPQTPSPPPPDLSRLWDSAGLRFRYASTLVDDPWGEYDDHRYWRSRRHDAVIGLDPRELLAQRRAHTFHASQYRSRRSRVSSATLYRRMRERHTRDFRRRIYMEGLWAVHQDNTRRYRDISPEFFTRNPAQIHRLVPWLNRELNAILYNQEETVSFALQLVMELTKRYELQSDEMHQHLESILGLHTRHFLHEYYCFARSPFDMTDYDTHAEYEQVLSVSGSDQDSDEDQRMGNTGVVQHQRNGRDASGSESSRDNLRGARRRKNSRVRRNADAGQGSSNTRSSRTHGINNASALSSIAYNLPSNRTLGGQGSWQSDFRNPEPIAERRNSSPVDFTPAPIVSRVRDFLEEVSDPNNASTSRSGWESPVLSRTTIFSSPPRAESPVIDIVSVTSTPENNPEVQNNSSSPECIDQKSPEYINPGSPETIDPGSAEDIKPGTSGVLNLSKDVEHVLASSNTQDSDSDSDVQFIKFEKPWGERTPIHLSSGPDSDIELLTKSSPFRKRKREKNRSQTRSKTRSRSRTRRRDRRSQTPLQYRQGRYRSSDRSERYLNKYSSKSREHTQHKHSHDRYRSVSRTRDRYHSKFRKSKSNSNKPGEMEKEKTEKNTRDSQKYEKLGKSTKRSVTGESERHEDYFRLSRYMSHNSSRRHYEKRLKSPSYTSKHKHKKKKDKRHRSRSVELVKVKRKHKHRSRSRKSKKSKKDIHRGYSYDEKSPIHIVEEVLPLSKHKEVTKKYKKNPTGHKSSTRN
ncbi:E3 ubiquitin-protein ligase Topors [Lingula anatina]|uniref:RING-type E3 ubiquitin transferase n=1 Tax=Lingula anatina TaxID=7574 RepID=A0A2R2MIN1_LINAN|nr:E3 ubiquitin-protein ligase Topors [Lingula anatina]|eukprot:XP_023930085.1 E3 ubiquitin-protein ligase Topors [Lingula anatina]